MQRSTAKKKETTQQRSNNAKPSREASNVAKPSKPKKQQRSNPGDEGMVRTEPRQ